MANRVSSLTVELIDDVSRPARSVAQAMADAEKKARAAAAAMGEDAGATDRLVSSLGKLDASKADIAAVSKAWVDYTKASNLAADSSNWTKEQIADVRSWETQTLSSVRAVMRERDAETRAMRSAAAEQATILKKQAEEQATIQRESVRAQKEAATQRRELARGVATGVGGGILGAFVGGETLEAIKEALGLGMTLDQRLVQLSSSGATAQQIEASRAKYREFTKTHPGVLEADWIKSRTEAQTIAPDAPDEMTELGARFQTAMRAAGRPLGEDDFQNVMRMMDELKNNTPEQRRNFLDQMAKIQQKYHGTVPLGTLLASVQNLRSAKFSLSDDFIGKYFPTLVQSMGEQGGTAIMTAFSNYVGGHMTHSELKNLAADGFVQNSDLMRLKNGEIKGTRPGAKLFEEDLLESNPFKWANDFHDEFMKRKGATEENFTKFIAALPRNMGSLIGEFVQHRSRYERDAENQNQPGLNADTNAELAKNPAAAADALRVSFEHLAELIAAPTLQALGPAMVAMATEVQKAGNYFGSLNQNLVALGGGVAALTASYAGLKALFGVGGGVFGGFGLKSSAVALDEFAAALSSAAVALGGKNVAMDAAAAAAGSAGILSRVLSWLQNSPALAAGSLNVGEASGNQGIADILKKAHPAWSDDDMKKWAREQLAPAAPAFEVRRPPSSVAHPGRDVHSPSTGPYSYTPATSVDTSSIDAAKSKADEAATALGQLGQTVHTSIDTSPIDAAIAKMHELKQLMSNIGSLSSGPGGMGPSLGSTIRGNFSFGGVNGE